MAGKLSTDEVMDYVDSEGLCAAILEYIAPNQISSRTLRENWAKARRYLQNIEAVLNGEDVEEDDDEDLDD